MDMNMSRVEDINTIAEELRQEPWHMFPGVCNCLGKTFRFRRKCREMNVDIKVVLAFVSITNKRFSFLPRKLYGFHSWAEIDCKRIELARPLDSKNPWDTYDINIKQVVRILGR